MIRGFLDVDGVWWIGVRAWNILDRPLIYANLSQSHLDFLALAYSKEYARG